MAQTLITGRSGTGKTQHLIDAINHFAFKKDSKSSNFFEIEKEWVGFQPKSIMIITPNEDFEKAIKDSIAQEETKTTLIFFNLKRFHLTALKYFPQTVLLDHTTLDKKINEILGNYFFEELKELKILWKIAQNNAKLEPKSLLQKYIQSPIATQNLIKATKIQNQYKDYNYNRCIQILETISRQYPHILLSQKQTGEQELWYLFAEKIYANPEILPSADCLLIDNFERTHEKIGDILRNIAAKCQNSIIAYDNFADIYDWNGLIPYHPHEIFDPRTTQYTHLETNFRNGPVFCEITKNLRELAIGQTVANNKSIFTKDEHPEKIYIQDYNTSLTELQNIAQSIKHDIEQKFIAPSEILVVVPDNNKKIQYITELKNNNIPTSQKTQNTNKSWKEEKFFEFTEICVNPKVSPKNQFYPFLEACKDQSALSQFFREKHMDKEANITEVLQNTKPNKDTLLWALYLYYRDVPNKKSQISKTNLNQIIQHYSQDQQKAQNEGISIETIFGLDAKTFKKIYIPFFDSQYYPKIFFQDATKNESLYSACKKLCYIIAKSEQELVISYAKNQNFNFTQKISPLIKAF